MTTRVGDHVRLIRGPIGAGFVALYVVIGRRVALVDTGFPGHPSQVIAPALTAAGLSLADVDLVLSTHGHPDHIGGHGAVVKVSGAEVRIHPDDAHRLPGQAGGDLALDIFSRAFRRTGLGRRADERDALLLELAGDPFGAPRALHDADRIELGAGVDIDVVHTPGHTGGSVSFIVHPDEIALVGDAVQGLGGSAGLPLYEDADVYTSSLERLAGLRLTVIGLGHPFRSANLAARSPIGATGAIVALLDESRGFPPIADQVAAQVTAERPPSVETAVREFLRRLPAPFDGHDATLESVRPASLHAALLHLDRAPQRP